MNDTYRVVSLRRAGDILAILPLLRMKQQKGKSVELVVHSDFVNVLDGVSYVTPIKWEGDMEDPLAAAEKHGAINAQVYGKRLSHTPNENYVYKAWSSLGCKWNRYLPLVIDRRDAKREADLKRLVFTSDKPKILVKLDSISSPFQHRHIVKHIAGEYADRADIVFLDGLYAERVYDLLTLYDDALCLITSDTVTLHLARSHKIPVIQLVNSTKWGASPMVGNVVLRIPYNMVRMNLSKIRGTLNTLVMPQRNEKMALIFSDWKPKDADTIRRHGDAYATWPKLGARMVPYSKGRNSLAIGDPHAMPYIADMVDFAMADGDEDIICIVNNDIRFTDQLRDEVLKSCKQYGCYWSYRLINHENTDTDNGIDFVAFTRKWWLLHKQYFPDFLLGYCWWDDFIARLMVWSGCNEQARCYYHESHPHAMETRPNTAGARYNESLAHKWMAHWDESNCKPIDLIKRLWSSPE